MFVSFQSTKKNIEDIKTRERGDTQREDITYAPPGTLFAF